MNNKLVLDLITTVKEATDKWEGEMEEAQYCKKDLFCHEFTHGML